MKGHYEIIIIDDKFIVKSGLSVIEGVFKGTPEQAEFGFNCRDSDEANIMFDIAKEVYKIINKNQENE